MVGGFNPPSSCGYFGTVGHPLSAPFRVVKILQPLWGLQKFCTLQGLQKQKKKIRNCGSPTLVRGSSARHVFFSEVFGFCEVLRGRGGPSENHIHIHLRDLGSAVENESLSNLGSALVPLGFAVVSIYTINYDLGVGPCDWTRSFCKSTYN